MKRVSTATISNVAVAIKSRLIRCIEAGEVLQQQKNIQPLYLPTIMNGTVPTYTYRLQPGISSDRHGMMIIENEGILTILETEEGLKLKLHQN